MIRLIRSGRFNFLFTVTFVVLVMSAFVGCEKKGPPTGDLLGKVYHDDELVDDCVVSLYSTTTKRSIGGKVDLNGEFEITKIPVGEYVVFFGQRTTNSDKEEPFDKRIPSKYRAPKTSNLSVSINEGENSSPFKMVD